MAILSKSKRLKKELTLLNVYAIATGTTLSAGFFLLPGLAASQAGPAVILSYLTHVINLNLANVRLNLRYITHGNTLLSSLYLDRLALIHQL